MKTSKTLLAAGAFALAASALGAGAASAHHAFSAEFDANAPVLLRGTVSKVEWINPHAWVHIMVNQPGKPARPSGWWRAARPTHCCAPA